MMIIAQGFRQIHTDPNGKKIVKFDQGMYNVPDRAKVKRMDGADWVWCDAHADEETGKGWAEIGGVKVKLAFNPFDDGDSKSEE